MSVIISLPDITSGDKASAQWGWPRDLRKYGFYELK